MLLVMQEKSPSKIPSFFGAGRQVAPIVREGGWHHPRPCHHPASSTGGADGGGGRLQGTPLAQSGEWWHGSVLPR